MPRTWVQSSVVEYWGILGVCATVFVLIMSFRQSRLNERRARMDEMMLTLHSRALYMARIGQLENGDDIARQIRRIDTSPKPIEISRAYLELHKLLETEIVRHECNDDMRTSETLQEFICDIDMFTNLRQQGRNFAELAVMTLFAVLTVLLALFVRPLGTEVPFAAFVNDVVTMILAAAFAFLVFDLADKRRDADAPLVQQASPGRDRGEDQIADWRLVLYSHTDPAADRWISSLLGLAVVAVFVVALYFKWLVP